MRAAPLIGALLGIAGLQAMLARAIDIALPSIADSLAVPYTDVQWVLAANFLGEAAVSRHGGSIDHMIDVVLAELSRPGRFDFGDRAFLATLREEARGVAEDRATWHLPPVDTLFVQRKVSGTALRTQPDDQEDQE